MTSVSVVKQNAPLTTHAIKQMKDFRDGKRADPVMAPMAVGLSDKDIEDLSAFYAKQSPSG